jgi:hypothetical protein
MELHTIGIDLGKTVFHLVGLNQRGGVVVRKKFSRKQLLQFTANLQVELIGMEACGGAHFLGRSIGSSAGARSASPVRRLKQAWCHGHRNVSPTTRPSASGPWWWVQDAPTAKSSSPRRARITSSPSTCPKIIPSSGRLSTGNPALKSGLAEFSIGSEGSIQPWIAVNSESCNTSTLSQTASHLSRISSCCNQVHAYCS